MTSTPDPKRSTLRRSMSEFEYFALAFGSMIGVGWVTAIGAWLTQGGPFGALIAFAIGGAIMLLIGACYAEVTPMLPVAGGEVAYSYLAFGTFKSFIVGWFLAFGYIAISGFEAISIGKVLGSQVLTPMGSRLDLGAEIDRQDHVVWNPSAPRLLMRDERTRHESRDSVRRAEVSAGGARRAVERVAWAEAGAVVRDERPS